MGKTLTEHGQYELDKMMANLGDYPANRIIAAATLALVKRFERQKLPENSASWVLDFFERICTWMPLTPITDDPTEWDEFEITTKNMATGEDKVERRWQSLRCPSLISTDGGKTFIDLQTKKEGTSVDYVQQAEEWAADREAEKNGGKQQILSNHPVARPPVDTSTPAGEASN